MPQNCNGSPLVGSALASDVSTDSSAMSVSPASPHSPAATHHGPASDVDAAPAEITSQPEVSASITAEVDDILRNAARDRREARLLERQMQAEGDNIDDDPDIHPELRDHHPSGPETHPSPTPAPRVRGSWTHGDPPELCPPEMRRLYGLFARPSHNDHVPAALEGDEEPHPDGSKRQWTGSPLPEEVRRGEPRVRTAQGSPAEVPTPPRAPDLDEEDLYFGPSPAGITYHPRATTQLMEDYPMDDDSAEPSAAPNRRSPSFVMGTSTRDTGNRLAPSGSRARGMYAGRLYAPLARPSLAPLRGGNQTAPDAWFADPTVRPPTAGPSNTRHNDRYATASTSLPFFDPRQAWGSSTPAPRMQHRSEDTSSTTQQEGGQPRTPYHFSFRPAQDTATLNTRAETPAVFKQPPPDARFESEASGHLRGPPMGWTRPGANEQRAPRHHPGATQPQDNVARRAARGHDVAEPHNQPVDYRTFQAAPRPAQPPLDADAPVLRPSWIAAQDDEQPTYTPRPPGGWPEMHRSDPEEPFGGTLGGMPLHRVQEVYEGPRATTLLAQVFNIGETPSARVARLVTDDMAAGILHRTGEMPCIVAPEASDRGRSNVWIIYGLSERAAAQLLAMEVVSMPAVSFRVFNRDLHMPQLLLTLGPLTGGTQESLERMIRWNLVGPLRQTIATLVERNPSFAHLTTDEAIQSLIETLRIRILTLNNGNRVLNVFMRSPTRSIELWREWVARLRTHEWRDRNHSTVHARRIALCACCHSADHPTHLCPFPHLPGWNGPMAGSGTHSSLPPPPPPQAPPSPGPSSNTRGRFGQDNTRGGARGYGRGRGRGRQ
ncbi:hypothetical protein K466DRAFT_602886 [Polyporus arcularius HHB13444]|uniref:Uncharacterized protein n=1 Tax=Polyporus arcularius HHB13444 TaxID=1314778 RepID=A0A5C3P1P7_9APHY|nr:hypothetical protein K466DRAFT_602886 [Polyporus arcularius HHB13444]